MKQNPDQWCRIAGALMLAAGLVPLSAQAAKSQVAIVHATVIFPDREPNEARAQDQTILIVGDRIRKIGSSADVKVPGKASTIDATGKFVIPGLIDGHVHFFQSANLYTRPDAADFHKYRSYADETKRNKERLPATFKVWLASGVTGVVDIGGPMWNFEMRDLARGTAAAPHVAVAGPLISMVARPLLDLGDPPIVRVNTTEEARALVRRELKRKPDYIKVWFINRPGDDLAAQTAIVRATAETAHAARVPLAVHATELVVAKAALQAGADFLVHSVFDAPVDDEFIALLKQRRALYCPTLFVNNGYAYALSNQWKATPEEERLADPQILARMHDLDRMPRDVIPQRVADLISKRAAPAKPTIAMQNVKKLWDAGIPIVMGTDAGNIGTVHGPSVFREMAYMQEAGLTPLQVLRSATTNAAKALRMENDVGSIAVGRLADLVILDADPLADLGNLSHAHRVLKGGVVYDPAELMRSIQ